MGHILQYFDDRRSFVYSCFFCQVCKVVFLFNIFCPNDCNLYGRGVFLWFSLTGPFFCIHATFVRSQKKVNGDCLQSCTCGSCSLSPTSRLHLVLLQLVASTISVRLVHGVWLLIPGTWAPPCSPLRLHLVGELRPSCPAS